MNGPVTLLAGHRQGQLVVTHDRHPAESVHCRCDCGTELELPWLKWRQRQSCGCMLVENRQMKGTIAAHANRPCADPTHERGPDPKYPGTGKTWCLTCLRGTYRRSAKKSHVLDRELVLAAYGGRCTCCGESREVFLTIDHIAEDGARHRAEITGGRGRRAGSRPMYRWLRQNDFPAGFQILCFNCNYAKHRLGECPHVTEREFNVGMA